MKFTQQRVSKACCGSFNYVYIVDEPLSYSGFEKLETSHVGIKLGKDFKAYNMIFIESKDFTITGSIGDNKIKIVCKNNYKIEDVISVLESL